MNKLLIISQEKEKYISLFEQSDLPDLEICHDLKKADIILADPPLITITPYIAAISSPEQFSINYLRWRNEFSRF